MDKAEIAKNLSGYIAAFIVLGSWSLTNYNAQTAMLDQKIQFEKYKSGEDKKLRDRELELEKEKLRLNEVAEQLKAAQTQASIIEAQANTKIQLVNEQAKKVASTEQQLSPLAQQAEKERQINILMSDFSNLGVNLNSRPPCRIPDALTKYNQAKVIMSQIKTLARAAGLYAKYQDFINSNSNSFREDGDDCR